MRHIEVDEDVFGYLQRKAVAYVETPNDTLRRLFDLTTPSKAETVVKAPVGREGGKAAKTSLPLLVRAGLLREGEKVYAIDYQGRRIRGYEATVSGSGLLWNGRRCAMSKLAEEALKTAGYGSTSVRGPLHWSKADGITVKVLWDRYMGRNGAK